MPRVYPPARAELRIRRHRGRSRPEAQRVEPGGAQVEVG
jgi:hypothetical protein